MKIGFFGTPDFARSILSDLMAAPDVEVAFVVTKPDAPFGRSSELRPNPVKALSESKKIPVFTPEKIRDNAEFFRTVQGLPTDYFVVAAYGKILPKALLDLPGKLCVNVHGSILPKYRGASPIQASLLAGDTETGITVMAMSEGMDEGDVLSVKTIGIDRFETAGTLFSKFSEISGPFLLETLRKYDAGWILPMPQNAARATYCSKIGKELGKIDWTLPAEETFYRWKGYSPWPGIFTFSDGKRLVIETCDVLSEDGCPKIPAGTVFRSGDGGVAVRTGLGALLLGRVKIEWKPSAAMIDFVNGHPKFVGSVLG